MTLSASVGGYVSNTVTKKPLMRRFQALKRYLGILELIYTCFLFCYVCFGILVLLYVPMLRWTAIRRLTPGTSIENTLTETIFLMVYCLQQIPAIILVVLILMQRKSATSGRSRGLKPSLFAQASPPVIIVLTLTPTGEAKCFLPLLELAHSLTNFLSQAGAASYPVRGVVARSSPP